MTLTVAPLDDCGGGRVTYVVGDGTTATGHPGARALDNPARQPSDPG
jgi:hypothetical protein